MQQLTCAGAKRPTARFISQAHLPIRVLVLTTCMVSASALPHAQTWSREAKRAPKGREGILIALSDSKLKSFGHKCDDDECGPKESKDREAPSFFQAGASMQPRATETDEGPRETEVFPEAEHVSNFSGLLQMAPRSAGTPAREGQEPPKAADAGGPDIKDEEVMAAMREAVHALEVRRKDDEVVLNALKDGQGAQDPSFNSNSSVDDQVLAALEDGIGAQEPPSVATRVSAVTVQENVSALNQSLPVQARALLPDARSPPEHVLPTSRFWSTRSGALAAAVGFVAATWLAVICLATGFWMAVFSGWREKGNLRSTIEAQRRSRSADLQKLMPSEGGYDCAFSKPVSSKQLLRLEVRVEGPETGCATLRAPLTGRSCVLHSAAVSKQLHDGMPAVPVAFSASSVDFMVTLVDDKETCIHIKGEDVSLFDMVNGKCIERTTFDAAPDSWQDFVLTHRSAPPQGAEWSASSSLRADDAFLEFQEASLLVGATVTVVGELHREVDGKLALRPWHGELKSQGKKLREAWRTSWERDEKASRSRDVLKKVLVSDDEKLLMREPEVEGKLRECASGLGNFLGGADTFEVSKW